MNNRKNLIEIGRGSYLNKEKILLLSSELNSRPIIELRERKKEENKLIKLSAGKESKCFIVLENGYLVILNKKAEELIEEINSE